MKKALLSLGSNMGNSAEILSNAVESISNIADTKVTAVSKLYETTPWGNVQQNNFLNLCVEIITSLSPEDLLAKLQRIELDAGRVRDIRWGPRTLDIDIILYEGIACNTEKLILPHPRFKERVFVLRPMADIYKDFNAFGTEFSFDGAEGEAKEIGYLKG